MSTMKSKAGAATLSFAVVGMMFLGVQLSHANEILCAQEGGACNLAPVMPRGAPDDKLVPGWEISVGVGQLPYQAGSGSSMSMNTVIAQNVSQVHCGSLAMDVSPGQGKVCYMQQVYTQPDTYTPCASEHSICNANNIPTPTGYPGAVARARIGDGNNKWGYFWTAGTVLCEWPTTAGFDPAPGVTKRCQVSTATIPALDDNNNPAWKQCAQENSACDLHIGQNVDPKYFDKERYLIAFGAQDSWVIREITSTEPIQCNLQVFRTDPKPGQGKFCYVRPYPMNRKVVSVTGDWVAIGQTAEGSGVGTFKVSYTVGTSTRIEHTQTKSWEKQVTDTLSATYAKGPVTLNASSVSVTKEQATSSTIFSSRTTQSTTTSASCTGYGMWQWVSTVTESCYEQSLCPPVVANTNITYCSETQGKPAPLY